MVPTTWLSSDSTFVLYPESDKRQRKTHLLGDMGFLNVYPGVSGWMEYDVTRVLNKDDPGNQIV